MEWFSLSTKVLDRQDLSINEKMCYVYLARFFQEEKEAITLAEVAQAMGVDEMVAKGAFFTLRTKGLISTESGVTPGTIIKARHLVSDELEAVFDIIDEPINTKEAKIILNFAGGDVDKVRDKYKIAKASQFQDKVEVLIHELQKKPQTKIIKSEDDQAQAFTFEDADNPSNQEVKTQINTYKLNQMQKYGKK